MQHLFFSLSPLLQVHGDHHGRVHRRNLGAPPKDLSCVQTIVVAAHGNLHHWRQGHQVNVPPNNIWFQQVVHGQRIPVND